MNLKPNFQYLLVPIMLSLSLCVFPQIDPDLYLNSLKDVRTKLLNGVQRIAAPGVPGPLLLTGTSAFPIVTSRGGNMIEQTVVAAAYLGRGRVVAFGHPGYFSMSDTGIGQTRRLLLNSIWWSSGAERRQLRVGLMGPSHLSDLVNEGGHIARSVEIGDWEDGLRSFDVIITWPSELNDQQIERLRTFVSEGRGLLAAGVGWGWQQLNPGKDLLSDNGGNKLLKSAGIAWSTGYASDPPEGYQVKTSVSPLVNAAIALGRIKTSRPMPAQERAQVWMSINQATEIQTFAGEIDRYLLSARKQDSLPGGDFPASVLPSAPRVSVQRLIPAAKLNTGRPAWHSTGLYAAPGDVVTLKVNESAVNKGLKIQIGSHTDKLWGKDKWDRFPDIIRTRSINKDEVRISSPFGGLIYITAPSNLKIRDTTFLFGGVIRAPSFEYGVNTIAEWKSKISRYPAPWAELVSDKVIITLPSETLRRIEDPIQLMRFWEKALDLTADLAARPRQRDRPERIVSDKQISAGYMHSGYPIMTHLDAADTIASFKELQTAWGLYHELGHNHQHPDWTFDGTVEVTCNLFTLYIRELATNTSPRKAFMDLGKRPAPETYFQKQRNVPAADKFAKWKKDPFLALAMYIQLQEAFGWKTYIKVFREYRNLTPEERPKNDLEKRDQWMVRFSNAAGYSLHRFFEEWGVPVSQEAKQKVAHLPIWMPKQAGPDDVPGGQVFAAIGKQ